VFVCYLDFSCLVLGCEVFGGVQVHVFHKVFDARFWGF
jgi:hypothetical protein